MNPIVQSSVLLKVCHIFKLDGYQNHEQADMPRFYCQGNVYSKLNAESNSFECPLHISIMQETKIKGQLGIK